MTRKFLVPLQLPADPANPLEAATKQYVDGLAGGSTILTGAGAPTTPTGSVGNFYVDTTGDDLYGPKNAAGFGADQRITVANAPTADFSGSWCIGARITFVRAGQITKIRYTRLSTSAASLELRIWNSGGTQVGSTINVADVGTGAFETTLGAPVAVAAGSTYTFSIGSVNPFPFKSTAQEVVTSTTDCTFVGFFIGSSASTFPNVAESNRTVWVEPTYQPNVGVWPLALETEVAAADLAGKVNGTTRITVASSAPSSPATGDLWVDTT